LAGQLRRLPLDLLVPVTVAVTVVAFATGSCSVGALNHAAKPVRWAALLVLLAVSAAWVVERRGPLRAVRPVLVAAVSFAALALLSAAWSVDPRLSAGRALSLAALFAAGLLLAAGAAGRPDAAERVLGGILAAAGFVAVVGLLLVPVDRADAVQAATFDVPARFKGFGENPNTVPLLLALALPVGLWFALRAHSTRVRLLAGALVVVFAGSIAFSGSRGALVGGFAGLAVIVAALDLPLRRRAAVAAGVAVLLAATLGAERLPKPTGIPPVAKGGNAQPSKPARYLDVEKALPLSFDIGTSLRSGAPAYGHGLFGSSGRSVAWRGALDTAQQRPALGFGFGTEAKVFVDRYALFEGGVPENSYIGLDLQLGAIGVLAFALLAVAILVASARGLRRAPPASACAAVFVAGLVAAVGQSYIYSVGNVGTATLWICGFLGAAAAVAQREVA
jgi:O-antigen ligase